MLNRCYRPEVKNYSDYGGRGIRVCDRWMGRDGFRNFLTDMGEAPSDRSLDRKENAGNYEPGNCRWATRDEQNSNRRSNRPLTGFGKTQLMEHWAKEYSIDAATLYDRVVARGMTLEEAVLHVPKFSKLTAEQVLAIRAAYAAGGTSLRKLAKQYGVAKGNILFIVQRKSWAHI